MTAREKTQSGKDASRKFVEQVEGSQNKVTVDPDRNMETDSETSKSMEGLETDNHEHKRPELAEGGNRAGDKRLRATQNSIMRTGWRQSRPGKRNRVLSEGIKPRKLKNWATLEPEKSPQKPLYGFPARRKIKQPRSSRPQRRTKCSRGLPQELQS